MKIKNLKLYIFLLIFLFLFLGINSLFAGTYVYYDEKGEQINFLPNNAKPKTNAVKKSRSIGTKGKPAGIPYEHKIKKKKQKQK